MKLALGRETESVRRRIAELVSARAAARIWERDASFWGGDAARRESVANRLGWLDVAQRMRAELPELRTFAGDVAAGSFTDAVVLGMGGSSLAPEVLRQSIADNRMASRHRGVRLHVLDTTDPATIGVLRERIDPARTLFLVASKSGGTIEVMSLFAYFYEQVSELKSARPGENFVAITDEGTSLQQLARERGFRRVFTNPGDIGGRYSALSFFGLVPAAVAGVDVTRLVDEGVLGADEARRPDSDALQLGAALGEMAARGRDKCTFIIAPQIASLGLWLEQLIAESTGKLGRGIVPVDGEPLGSPLQYSDDRVFVQIRLEADSNGENDAVAGALVAEGFPVIVIDLDNVYELAREFVRWEFAVAVAGQVLDINPFDEPNVQESKDNTGRVLRAFEASGALDDAAGLITVGGETPDAPERAAGAVARLIEDTPERGYLAITSYTRQDAGADEAFADMRRDVRDATGVATTLGYGPRFLHSTGQLHKGGPATGAFLQVTADDAIDIQIPGRPYTFGQLKRAQAIGDFEALRGHGRPVARVHVQGDITHGIERLRDIVREATAAGTTKER